MAASHVPFLLKKKTLLPSMASLFLLAPISFLIIFTLFSPSTPAHHHLRYPFKKPPPFGHLSDSIPPNLTQACKATRFPDLCISSLSLHLPPSPSISPVQIIQSAMQISADNLKTAISMVQSILGSSAGNLNRSTAANNCLEVLHNSQHRVSLSTDALTRGKIKDVRAWMSGALLYQYDCWNSLKYANDTKTVNDAMAFIDSMEQLTSNALSMVVSYYLFSDRVELWSPPKTERDGFWEPVGVSGDGFSGGLPSGLTPDVTVCKGDRGNCRYETVQEAVNAAPAFSDGRFVIGIKAGVYEETVRVPLEKTNVVFIGDGMGRTVITGSLNVGQPGISTYNTATVGVVGDGFLARGITIKNTAGPDAHQAVAFRSDSDKSIIENCEFIGHQDTLYAHGLRQFYKSCRIEGNVDFIFGNSASIFQDCDIQISPRQLKPEKGETNAVTAHGRTDPAQSTGFVFQSCRVNGTPEYMDLFRSKPQVHKNYLGRPWKEYSRTVFVNCSLEGLVSPQGWLPWTGEFALNTLYYGEFKNYGAGAETAQRVSWSSQVEDAHVEYYSVPNFIQGNEWIPIKMDE